jgi:hypothetical protein
MGGVSGGKLCLLSEGWPSRKRKNWYGVPSSAAEGGGSKEEVATRKMQGRGSI